MSPATQNGKGAYLAYREWVGVFLPQKQKTTPKAQNSQMAMITIAANLDFGLGTSVDSKTPNKAKNGKLRELPR